jgi:hypothetical protein
MKSNTALIVIALLCLTFAVAASVVIWEEAGSAVKIGMFALGFGCGVPVGALILRRTKS